MPEQDSRISASAGAAIDRQNLDWGMRHRKYPRFQLIRFSPSSQDGQMQKIPGKI
jgi:hypothetical protein